MWYKSISLVLLYFGFSYFVVSKHILVDFFLKDRLARPPYRPKQVEPRV